jgi:hypothetical protein
MLPCARCADRGYVCEEHPDLPFLHKGCFARGTVCPLCHGRLSQPAGFSFNPPKWRGTPEYMGEMWRLTQGHQIAVCSMWNHEDGAEVRCDVDGDTKHRLIGCTADLFELLAAVEAWRALFTEEGWIPDTSRAV